MIEFGEGLKPSHDGPKGPAFGEIIGQAELKEALLAVAANDALDGVLLSGEKGTAKSTAVRALRDLLPRQTAVADCPYGCPPDRPAAQCQSCRERTDPPTTERPVPLVTLPLGATRERVVGSLSVAEALDGDHEFEPGLLARANRGILYVDEVNLLDDHLVDVLLDAAASGVNRVERDGVSVVHPAAFTLVGTMNPEEGDLRPQLRDRFALQATVTGCAEIDDRVAIIEQAVGEGDGGGRATHTGPKTEEYRERLAAAREHLEEVTLAPAFAEEIAELCRDAGVDGHRADIATARAARTFAALDGRTTVLERDVRQAASLALPHRLQARPFEDAPETDDLLDEHFEDGEGADEGEPTDTPEGADADEESGAEATGDGDGDAAEGETACGPDDATGEPESEDQDPSGQTDGENSHPGPGPGPASGDDAVDADSPPDTDGATAAGQSDPQSTDEDGGEAGDDRELGTPLVPGTTPAAVGDGTAPAVDAPDVADAGSAAGGSGSAARPSADGTGPRVRVEPADERGRIDVGASVRAAGRRGATAIESRDLRQSIRERETSTLVVFAVDASASMRPAMRAAKGTVLELLEDAYQQRDEVAFVAFAGDDAEVLLPPTDSVTLAARHLKDLPTGDRTPLPAGLRTAGEVIDRADPAASVVVVVTDGRANVAEGSPVAATRDAATALAATGAHVVVVDAGEADRPGVVDAVADSTDGQRVPLAALSADRVDAVAGAATETGL